MSATNATATISLPLFIGTDKPAWLTDWNGAMNTIDSAIATLQTAESGTATSLASLAQSVEALSGTVSQHTTALTTISTAVSGNTGSINTINSLIGNGTPTTTDQTIIGAINELHAEIGGGSVISVPAADVTYDNTTSGMTADDVQEAIDELHAAISGGGGASTAADVSYDNTTSGLTADDVQEAIDEIDATVDSIGSEIGKNNYGASVNISSYTSTMYTVPSDGYLSVDATSSARIYAASATDLSSSDRLSVTAPAGAVIQVFVRKGMKLNCQTGSAYFRPLE